MDADTARKRLQVMLANLDRVIAVLRGEQSGEIERSAADAGLNLTESDRAGAMLEAASDQRTAVLAALTRVDDGTYGNCVDCRGAVPDGRLEARPEAARCVKCQSKREKSRR